MRKEQAKRITPGAQKKLYDSAKKRSNKQTQAAADTEEDEGSVASRASSVGSRSSARLKRKREAKQAKGEMIVVDPLPEEDEDGSPPATNRKPRKRHKNNDDKGADKKTAPDELDDEMSDNGGEEYEDDDDTKLPAAPHVSIPINGHATTSNDTSSLPSAVTAVLSVSSYNAPPASSASATTIAVQELRIMPPSNNHPHTSTLFRLNESATVTSTVAAAVASKTATTVPLPPKQQHRISSGRLILEPAPTPFKKQQPQPNADDDDNDVELPRQPREEEADVDGIVNAAAAEPVEHEPVMQRLYQQASDTWIMAREWTTARIVEVTEVLNQRILLRHEVVETAVDDGNDNNNKTSPWDRTVVWFLLFFVLQMVLFPLWLNPILSSTVSFSKVCLAFYQGILLAAPLSSNVVVSDDVLYNNQNLLLDKLLTLEKLQEELQAAADSQQEAIHMLNHQSVAVQEAVARQETIVQERASKLRSIVDQLELLVQLDDSLFQNPLVTTVADLVANDSSGTTLLDLSKLELWTVASSESENAPCEEDETPAADDVASLQLADVETALEQLQTEAKEAALAIQHDPATVAAVRTWIRDTLEQEINHIALDAGASAATTTKPGVGERLLRRVRKMIATRLAIESADQTGQIDYASIRNGATVLSSSPSLVDNLPVMNRLAAIMSLRFYGYGPEAALTPTHPPNALGQCWAFEKQAHRKVFGTLTVRLAKSVYVESVLIEHPPRELSDRVDTAIRTFHLTGFEHDQSGKAWPLGSFEYSLSDDSIRQEFPVADEVDGEDVPALRVIRLQIDSNWGAKYACLYRFRVHGQEKEDD